MVTPLCAPRTRESSPSVVTIAWEMLIEPAAIIVSVDAVPGTVATLLIPAVIVILPVCPFAPDV